MNDPQLIPYKEYNPVLHLLPKAASAVKAGDFACLCVGEDTFTVEPASAETGYFDGVALASTPPDDAVFVAGKGSFGLLHVTPPDAIQIWVVPR